MEQIILTVPVVIGLFVGLVWILFPFLIVWQLNKMHSEQIKTNEQLVHMTRMFIDVQPKPTEIQTEQFVEVGEKPKSSPPLSFLKRLANVLTGDRA